MDSRPTNALVNKIAKYLYKSFDSSEKLIFRDNQAEIIFGVYYQSITRTKTSGKSEQTTYSELEEMDMSISLATYSNKIRVYVVELSPDEQTLFFKVYDPIKFDSLEDIRLQIFKDIRNKLTRLYDGYEFIF